VNAEFAYKLLTCRAVVTDVFEIELAVTFFVFTAFLCDGFHNQSFGIWLGCQIHRSVSSCIFFLDINAQTQKSLKNLELASSCSLMHSGVAILVDVIRVQIILKKLADQVVVTLISCPVQRSVFSHFPSVFGLLKGIVLPIIVITHFCSFVILRVDIRLVCIAFK
jgi:hypothetical protein